MNYEQIIKTHYRKYLKREPDEEGFQYFLNLMNNNILNEQQLVESLLNSEEFKRLKKKEYFEKKYDFEKDFYGKIWVGKMIYGIKTCLLTPHYYMMIA